MYRKPLPQIKALEELTEQRDDLKIQLHLAGEKDSVDPDALKELRDELAKLERKLEAHWRRACRS